MTGEEFCTKMIDDMLQYIVITLGGNLLELLFHVHKSKILINIDGKGILRDGGASQAA